MDYDYSTFLNTMIENFAGLFLILGILILAVSVVSIIACWKLYKKAGKEGWKCLVPFYSYWVLVEIAGLNWWWFLLIISSNVVSILGFEDLEGLADLVNLFASFNCYYNIAKKFNKSNGYAVCAGIFSFVFILIFAFSKDEVYDMNVHVSKNGIFGTPEEHNNNYQNNNTSVDNSNDQNISNNSDSTKQEFVFCGNCGTKLASESRFCSSCGKEIK